MNKILNELITSWSLQSIERPCVVPTFALGKKDFDDLVQTRDAFDALLAACKVAFEDIETFEDYDPPWRYKTTLDQLTDAIQLAEGE